MKRDNSGKFISDPQKPSVYNTREYKNQNQRNYNKRKKEGIILEKKEKKPVVYDGHIAWTRMIKFRYGITENQFNELLQKQDFKCFICQRHKDEFKSRLCIDHNHATGEVRGLLCKHCNQKIIGREKSAEIFKRAMEYLLQEPTGWFVPKRKKRRSRKRLQKVEIIDE